MLLPYNYFTQGDHYTFTTDLNLTYKVTFNDLSDNLNTNGNYNVIEFAFFCVDKVTKFKYDARISITLLDLLRKFLEKNQDVLLFVCDANDGKARCRKITFNKWIKEDKGITNIATKHDASFGDQGIYYCSLIVGKDHPFRDIIVSDFLNGDLFWKEYK